MRQTRLLGASSRFCDADSRYTFFLLPLLSPELPSVQVHLCPNAGGLLERYRSSKPQVLVVRVSFTRPTLIAYLPHVSGCMLERGFPSGRTVYVDGETQETRVSLRLVSRLHWSARAILAQHLLFSATRKLTVSPGHSDM